MPSVEVLQPTQALNPWRPTPGSALPLSNPKLNPCLTGDELVKTTQLAVTGFLGKVGYVMGDSAFKIDPSLEHDLLDIVKSWNLGLENDPRFLAECNAGYLSTETMYNTHERATKLHMSLFTSLMFWADDYIERYPKAFHEFQTRALSGAKQLHPVLDHLIKTFRDMQDYFNPVIANLIATSALEHTSSTIMEAHPVVNTMQVKVEPQYKWPTYLRRMTGITAAYAYFAFPKEQFPELDSFLLGIPDMIDFINLTNDLLSFYKEELAGETQNYMHFRAQCTGKSVARTVLDVAEEAAEAAAAIRHLYKDDPKNLTAYNNFIDGYIQFHLTSSRYKMHRVGLGEEEKHI